ncbi:hypothetical protein [Pseudodesulfovibrio sp. zrk46]|uniref:hypothetical protein n=1 Tax=Pseudodesulfovibrio sp. zrk46 TaxID=2725288 RepID=UPI00144957B0|nr:hypothetical protein [Pseudodesulfovibrio sp. zrk46]QJB55643.1 hypothetical protein HFN16_04180 [Pseudodesulfovibrio sp. zrk46]
MNTAREALVTVSADMQIQGTSSEIWPLLCPVAEYDWIDGWKCELVHSESGVNELGCVFRTDPPGGGGTDTWVTSRFEPNERLEFVRVNPIRAIRYEILLFPEGDTTRMEWIQHLAPLNEEGRTLAEGWSTEFKQQMSTLEKMLNHYLSSGEMLRL